LKEPSHPNSFFNPNSESTLTLFMLGNLDRWNQFYIQIEPPRDKNSSWNQSFFRQMVTNQDLDRKLIDKNTWWENLGLSEIIGVERGELEKNILLFEVELYSNALHLDSQSSKNNISFLDLENSRRWVRYDAVMMIPCSKKFVFFESKFRSGLSTNSLNYPRIDQMMKGLEAAHLLTENEMSPYNDWDFNYILICPKLLHDYELTRYNKKADSIGKHLVEYNDLLNDRYNDSINKRCYPENFESFIQKTPGRVFTLHWKDLGEALLQANSDFFSNYFSRLEETCFDEKRLRGIRKKFREAGIRKKNR